MLLYFHQRRKHTYWANIYGGTTILMATKYPSFKHKTDSSVQITELSWERLFLNVTIDTSCTEPLSFSLAVLSFSYDKIKYDDTFSGITEGVPAMLRHEVPISPDAVENGRYRFHLNMSLIDNASFPENGRWYFITRKGDDPTIIIASISYDLSYKLPDMDRVFPYGKSRYAFTVHFTTISFDSANIIPSFTSKFMIENKDWKDTLVIRERKTFVGRFRCALKKFKIWLLQLVYNLCFRFNRHDGKHVLLMSETKPYLWGNLKYIDARIKSRGLDKDLTIDYSFRIAVGRNNSALNWFRVMKKMAMQDFIFVDDFAPLFSFLKLNSHTKLIQVWHAGEGFKAVGYARFGSNNSPHPLENCHRKYDYVITGSKRLAEVYSEVFGQPYDHILPVGMARLDDFLDEKAIKTKTADFYNNHPECKGKKLILFAPTFRGANQRNAYYNYEKLDLNAIYDFCGDDYIWAFKMHPFVKKKPPIPDEYSDRIIDLSKTTDINDLYYVADMLITDYSSANYEYSILKKPILFYTYDRVVYEIVRGVHKSILETAPGKVCYTFDELITALRNGGYDIEKTLAFREANFGEYDGKAADRIIDTIILGHPNNSN